MVFARAHASAGIYESARRSFVGGGGPGLLRKVEAASIDCLLRIAEDDQLSQRIAGPVCEAIARGLRGDGGEGRTAAGCEADGRRAAGVSFLRERRPCAGG